MLLCILYFRVDSFLWSVIVYWSVVLGPSAACFLTFCLLLFPSHQVSCAPDISKLMFAGMRSQILHLLAAVCEADGLVCLSRWP